MSGLDRNTPIPTELKLHTASRVLEVSFDDGSNYRLPFEFLRVYSPSAEVRGHGVGQGTLQSGKRDVVVTGIEPVGNYAVKIVFSDGHNSGLYSWDVLHDLGSRQEQLWQDYLKQLEAAGANRDVDSTSAKVQAAQHGHHHSPSCKH